MADSTPLVQGYDYSLFGEVEVRPLSRIRQVIARRLSASWATVPHVAQFEEVDIGALEAMRSGFATDGAKRPTLLAFAMKACAHALHMFPEFNASVDGTGQKLVLKKYCHIAFAAQTPVGLMAPVVRDVDQKDLQQIANAIVALADKARQGRLALSDAEGACFTVTNLGALGGTGFIPIINAPEIGILGMARAGARVVERDGQLVSRPVLPLTLVYDHRVIDGAVGARFMAAIVEQLANPGNWVLAGRSGLGVAP